MGILRIFVAFLRVALVSSYVYDVDYSVVISSKSQEKSSLFGYSLDFSRDRSGEPWIFVGAPKDTQREISDTEPSGSLNACKLQLSAGNINAVECNSRPTNLDTNTAEIYTDQLFGVSVVSGNEEVWSCAPRYQKPHQKNWGGGVTELYYVMWGHCFSYSSRDNFARPQSRLKPLEGKKLFYGRDGYGGEGYENGVVFGESGLSLHYDQSTDETFFGAPGVWNWTGTFSFMNNDDKPVLTQPWSTMEPRTNDYAGYEITTGLFMRQYQSRPRRHVALGAPRSGQYRQGTVYIVEHNHGPNRDQVKQIGMVSGRQTGEYFGAALAAVDVNGDGIDELIVGSPLFTHDKGSSGNTESGSGSTSASFVRRSTFEEGRVSIFDLDRNDRFQEKLSIFSHGHPGSRFGAAISNLDDLDGDGFGDFAVGSPFEDNGKGAVRIYFGKKNIELMQDPLQLIRASDVAFNLQGFGISFSKSHADIDGNQLADLAIGSHTSGNAVLLRRRPSTWVTLELKSSIDSIDISSIKEFYVQVCATLNSYHSSNVKLNTELTLKPDVTRTKFKNNQDELKVPQTLKKGERYCFESAGIEMKPGFNPVAQEPPLVFIANARGGPEVNTQTPEIFFDGLSGTMDPRFPSSAELNIPFQSDCQGQCSIDLTVKAEINPEISLPFVIGSSQFLTLSFIVANLGRDSAYRPIVKIPLPDIVLIRNMPSDCTKIESTSRSSAFIQCRPIGPIKPLESRRIPVEFDISKLSGGMETLKWSNFEVYSESSVSEDVNKQNNYGDFLLLLATRADLALKTAVKVQELQYKDSKGEPMEKTFTQTFQVVKYHPSPLHSIEAQVDIPTHYGGHELFQFISGKVDFSNGEKLTCTLVNDAQRTPIGRASENLPQTLNCVTPGARCLEIKCPQFEIRSELVTATVMVNLKFLAGNLKSFKSENITLEVASEGHVQIMDEELRQKVEQFNKEPDNVFATTRFVDKKIITAMTRPQVIKITLIALGIFFGLLIFLCVCGFFRRKQIPVTDDTEEAAQKLFGVNPNEDPNEAPTRQVSSTNGN